MFHRTYFLFIMGWLWIESTHVRWQPSLWFMQADCRIPAFTAKMSECIQAAIRRAWMWSNRFQPNPDKTEVLWCATTRRQHQLPTIHHCWLTDAPSLRFLPYATSASTLIPIYRCGRKWSTRVSRCFSSLQGRRQIRRCVPPATLQMMVVALVHSRLDYTGMVYWSVFRPMRQLQSVLNAAARLIFRLKFSDYIIDALISLHWLQIPERIHCKLAVVAYKVLHGRAPSYLRPLVRVADVSGRRALSSAGTNRILVPPVTSTTVGSRAFSVAAPLICCVVAHWYGVELAMYRSRVQFPAGGFHVT